MRIMMELLLETNYLTSEKQLENLSSTIAVCDSIRAAEYYEVKYSIASYPFREIKSTQFWEKIIRHTIEFGKLTILIVTKQFSPNVQLLLLLTQFYSIPVLYAGPHTLLTEEERNIFRIPPIKEATNAIAVVNAEQLDHLPNTQQIVLSKRLFFSHWFRLARWQINADIIISDHSIVQQHKFDLARDRKIMLQALHIIKKANPVDLNRLFNIIVAQKWSKYDRILQNVMYYGLHDQYGYEALKRYFAYEQINYIEQVALNTYTIEYINNGKLKVCTINLQKTYSQCSCSQYAEATPCMGQLLLFTQAYRFPNSNLQLSVTQIIQYLRGFGIVAGLLHLELIYKSNRVNHSTNEEHYELTKAGHLLAKWEISDSIFFAIQGIIHSLAINESITLQILLEHTLHIYSPYLSIQQIMTQQIVDYHKFQDIQIYLQMLQLLSHKYGLYDAYDSILTLRKKFTLQDFSFI